MVTSQASVHLLVLLVCCSVASHPSDGAKLYGPTRRLEYEDLYEDMPTPENVYEWGQKGNLDGGEMGSGINHHHHYHTNDYVEEEEDLPPVPPVQDEAPALPFTTLDELRELLFSAETRSRIPTRGYYIATSSSSPLRHRVDGSGGSGRQWREEEPKQKRQREEMEEVVEKEQDEEHGEQEDKHQQEEEEEEHRRQIQLYMAYRRPPSPHTARGSVGGGVGERGTKEKRWWSGRRTSGQVDRRASQTKHYTCLKSCINAGKLHPIQCHTLC